MATKKLKTSIEKENTHEEIKGCWAIKSDVMYDWCFLKDAFSKEECQKIIEIGKSKNILVGTIGSKKGLKEESKVRKSEVAFLHPTNETAWIFKRLVDITDKLNSQFFEFDIFGFVEGLQFTQYQSPNGHYGFHTDRIPNGLIRKLSITIQLSDPLDYTGGDLELKTSEIEQFAPRDQGCLTMFPSYILHRVKPVTDGTRYSLVAWVTGKKFK
jgi:PKHD-type hydroxylase